MATTKGMMKMVTLQQQPMLLMQAFFLVVLDDGSGDEAPLFEGDGDDLYDPFGEAAYPLPPLPSQSSSSSLSQPWSLPSSSSSSFPSSQSSPPPSQSQLSSSSLPPSQSLPSSSLTPQLSSSLSPSQSQSSAVTPLSSVSVVCRPGAQIEQVRCVRRPRKPSPPRTRQPTSDEKLEAFLEKGCGCKLNRGSECCYLFDDNYIHERRDQCNALSRDSLDMAIIAQISAFIAQDDVVGPSHRHLPSPRHSTRVAFFHSGKKICQATFLALHGIGKHYCDVISFCETDLCTLLGRGRYNTLKAHYLAKGLQQRVHGNTKRLPYNTIKVQDTENALKFIRSFAQSNAILLPGRIPGYKRDDLQLLPSSTTKKVELCV